MSEGNGQSNGFATTEDPKAKKEKAPKVYLACRSCGFEWDSEKKRDYRKADDGTVRCRDARSCRSRKLAADLGIDLFARYPRELLITLMDRRPPNWKETGWRSIFWDRPEIRVGAAIIYFSWCFPVSMPYACQTFTKEDGDEDILKDRYGQPVRQTQTTLAAFLNIPQQQVSKAIIWRERRKLLRQEDGRIYPEPKPQALTCEERLLLCTDVDDANLKDLKAFSELPRQIRHLLASLLSEAPPELCTDVKERAKVICTQFNQTVANARTARNEGARVLCTELANILGRGVSFKEAKEQASGSGASPGKRPPASKAPHDGPRNAAAKQLYEDVPALQALYPDSAFSKSRFSMGKADLVLVGKILDKLEPTGYDAEGFVRFVMGRFRSRRSPDDEGGPRSLGLLIDWAGDYARELANAPTAAPISQADQAEIDRQRARYFLDNREGIPADVLEWARGILDEPAEGGTLLSQPEHHKV